MRIKKHTESVKIDKGLLNQLRDKARAEGRFISWVIEQALKQYLSRKP